VNMGDSNSDCGSIGLSARPSGAAKTGAQAIYQDM
jgi:hypothetical protein